MFDGQFYPFQPIQFMGGLMAPPIGVSPVLSGLTFVDSAVADGAFGVGGDTITVPVTAQAGDWAVLFDWGNGGGSVPSDVTPSGWTQLATAFTSGGNQGRVSASYKVLGSGDPGASITGINAGGQNNKIVFVFRPDGPISAVTPSTWQAAVTTGDPAAQSITASGQATPLIVLAASVQRNGSGGNATFSTQSPAFTATVSNAVTRIMAGYTIYNSSPANHTVDTGGSGELDGLISGYVSFS